MTVNIGQPQSFEPDFATTPDGCSTSTSYLDYPTASLPTWITQIEDEESGFQRGFLTITPDDLTGWTATVTVPTDFQYVLSYVQKQIFEEVYIHKEEDFSLENLEEYDRWWTLSEIDRFENFEITSKVIAVYISVRWKDQGPSFTREGKARLSRIRDGVEPQSLVLFQDQDQSYCENYDWRCAPQDIFEEYVQALKEESIIVDALINDQYALEFYVGSEGHELHFQNIEVKIYYETDDSLQEEKTLTLNLDYAPVDLASIQNHTQRVFDAAQVIFLSKEWVNDETICGYYTYTYETFQTPTDAASQVEIQDNGLPEFITLESYTEVDYLKIDPQRQENIKTYTIKVTKTQINVQEDTQCGTPGSTTEEFTIQIFCSDNSDCPDTTRYCDVESGVCAICSESSQCNIGYRCGNDGICDSCDYTGTNLCDVDKTCQSLVPYKVPYNQKCYSTDLISQFYLCEEAADYYSYDSSNIIEQEETNQPPGCYDFNGQIYFNQALGAVADTDETETRFSICRNQASEKTCMTNDCITDDDCKRNFFEENSYEHYCQNGQCRTKTCSSRADCAQTNFCDTNYGVCGVCQEVENCDSDAISCTNGVCIQCEVASEDKDCSQIDLSEHCQNGLCTNQKRCEQNSDCSRTKFCDNTQSYCALCDASSSCDPDFSCQTLGVYSTAAHQACYDSDQIQNANLCEAAVNELLAASNTVATPTRNYNYAGTTSNSSNLPQCFYNSYLQVYYNTHSEPESNDSIDRYSICRKTSDSFTCLADTCTSDADCPITTASTTSLEQFCQDGQCRTKTCTNNSECPTTSFCNTSYRICITCASLDYSTIANFPTEIYMNVQIDFTPDLSLAYEFDSSIGLQTQDEEGRLFSNICDTYQIAIETSDPVSQFAITDSSSFIAYDSTSAPIVTFVSTQFGPQTVTVQKSSDYIDSDTEQLSFTVKLTLTNTFTLDETITSEALEFQLGSDEITDIPYTLTTQEPEVPYDLTFEFSIDSEVIDWVTADQRAQIISVSPRTSGLGTFTVDIQLTLVYTETSILDYLEPLSSGNQIILSDYSFDISILQEESSTYTVEVADYEEFETVYTEEELFEYMLGNYTEEEEVEDNNGEETQEEDTNTQLEENEEEEHDSEDELESGDELEFVFDHGFNVDELEVDEEKPAPTVTIQSISNTGNLILSFDQMMDFSNGKPGQNDLRLVMNTAYGNQLGEFIPYKQESKRRLEGNQSKFTWTIKEVEPLQIVIDITFTDPLEVSQEVDADFIFVEFISDFFVSLQSKKPLKIDSAELLSLTFKIPQQFASLEEKEQITSIAVTATTFVSCNFGLLIVGQIFANRIIKKIIPLYLTLQLVFYCLLKFQFPLYTMAVMTMLSDAIKLRSIKEWADDFQKENETVQGLKDLADDTGMIVFIGVPLVLFLIIIAVLIQCMCKKFPKCQAIGAKLKNRLIFGMTIQILIISYLAFLRKAGFGRAFDSREERPGSNFIMVLVTIGLVWVSFFFAKYVDTSYFENDINFETKYGIFYKKYRYWNPQASLFIFYFFLHRIGIVFVLNLQVPFSVSYYGLTFLQVSWLAYLILYDPYLEKQETNKEILNSYLLLLFSYFIPAYTLMTPRPEVRNSFSIYTIVIVSVMIVVNLIWTIVQIIQDKCKQKVYKRILAEKLKQREFERITQKYIIQEQPVVYSEQSIQESSSESEEEKVEEIVQEPYKEQITIVEQEVDQSNILLYNFDLKQQPELQEKTIIEESLSELEDIQESIERDTDLNSEESKMESSHHINQDQIVFEDQLECLALKEFIEKQELKSQPDKLQPTVFNQKDQNGRNTKFEQSKSLRIFNKLKSYSFEKQSQQKTSVTNMPPPVATRLPTAGLRCAKAAPSLVQKQQFQLEKFKMQAISRKKQHQKQIEKLDFFAKPSVEESTNVPVQVKVQILTKTEKDKK